MVLDIAEGRLVVQKVPLPAHASLFPSVLDENYYWKVGSEQDPLEKHVSHRHKQLKQGVSSSAAAAALPSRGSIVAQLMQRGGSSSAAAAALPSVAAAATPSSPDDSSAAGSRGSSAAGSRYSPVAFHGPKQGSSVEESSQTASEDDNVPYV